MHSYSKEVHDCVNVPASVSLYCLHEHPTRLTLCIRGKGDSYHLITLFLISSLNMNRFSRRCEQIYEKVLDIWYLVSESNNRWRSKWWESNPDPWHANHFQIFPRKPGAGGCCKILLRTNRWENEICCETSTSNLVRPLIYCGSYERFSKFWFTAWM